MGYERTSDEPLTPRQRKHRKSTPQGRQKMRSLRLAGTSVEEIARITGFSVSVVHRWTKDVPLPRKRRTRAELKAESDRKVTALERKQRRATDKYDLDYVPPASATLPQRGVVASPEKKVWPFHFDQAGEYGTTGPSPDPLLVTHAESILEQWVAGTAKGRIYERRINVNQATLVYASSLPAWHYETFLQKREMWRAVRALSRVNSTELASRLSISPVSISRYEKNTRNPPKQLMRDLHTAYTELLEHALQRAEWNLIVDSWADTVIAETGILYDQLTDTMSSVEKWIGQDTDLEDFTIDHIEHLAVVRGFLPYPQWREPSAGYLWLKGYPDVPALHPA